MLKNFEYALILAFLSGLILLVLGLARLGFLVNFLSHPVISGFTSAAAVVIGLSQLKSLLGFDIPRGKLVTETLVYTISHLDQTNVATAVIGIGAIVILVLCRQTLGALLARLRFPEAAITVATKAGPFVVVFCSTIIVWGARLNEFANVTVVGEIPSGLPPLTMPSLDLDVWQVLLPASLMIAFIGFLESISVAKALASKRREKIDANQELIALGMANIGASLTGGYPVTGGFSRSVVNFMAGATTALSSVITAMIVVLTALFLTPLFYYLPHAVFGAIIVVAVSSLVDVKILFRAWRYNKADALALPATFGSVLSFGVELGILIGITLSLGLYLFRTSRPHIAIVGRIEGTEHFRNVDRHKVKTCPSVLALRVDESLYFANTRYLEDRLLAAAAEQPELAHVVLICSAVNFIDMSAVETLQTLIGELRGAGITLHLAEVKGPVMDDLDRSELLKTLMPGEVFLSTHDAMMSLGCLP